MSGLRYRRVLILLAVLSTVFLILLGRLIQIQLFDDANLAARALNNYHRFISAEDYPRGYILDRNGKSLTGSQASTAVLIIPSFLQNEDKQIEILAECLDISEAAVRSKFKNDDYAYIQNISQKEAEHIRSFNMQGVYVVQLDTRYGPESLARHLIGHLERMGARGWDFYSPFKGAKGIEAVYDNYLSSGVPSSFWSLAVDGRGNIIPGLSFNKLKQKEDKRNNIILTIDAELQKKVEEIMDMQVSKGAVVVMDVSNGDILASASRPNYDQNFINKYIDGRNIRDDVFSNKVFEYFHPGSIFKTVIAAAALEENIVAPEEEFYCDGEYTFDTGLTIKCWETEGHGEIIFKDSLAYSCNPLFLEVALELGREKIIEYADKFHLTGGELIGYPLAGKDMINIEPYGKGKIGNAALGQEGVQVTPLQVAVLMSTVANDGHYISPRVIKKIVDSDGKAIKEFPTSEPEKIIAESTAAELQEMLAEAVRSGTAQNAWIPGFGAAGKTGSAETGRAAEGKSINNVWFAGYVPEENPQYAIVVFAEEGESGGETAAPIFRDIGEYILD